MSAVAIDAKKIRIDTSTAVAVHLEGPGRGPVIGRIAKDAGPASSDYPRGPLKDYPYHAILDGERIVASCESYGVALNRLLEAWVVKRMGMETGS